MNKRINVKPLKKFGQNYLQDKNILAKIADEFNPAEGENIIEIGPGTGNLTEVLYSRVKNITGVEIDSRVAEELRIKFPGMKLVQESILDCDLAELRENKEKPLRVIGNIPYNLTSPILFHLLKQREIVEDAVLLMQLEVAERLTSSTGTKAYGILAAIFNAFADIELCFKVSPNVFFPKPKVFSAVVHVRFRNKYNIEDERTYIQTVKAGFATRRKTLKNALNNSIFKDINFADCPTDLKLRAEQLTIPGFIQLADYISLNRKK